MTETLVHLTAGIEKLTPTELDELRAWLAEYQPAETARQDVPERRVDWSDLAERRRAIFGDRPPLEENVVLALRREERF